MLKIHIFRVTLVLLVCLSNIGQMEPTRGSGKSLIGPQSASNSNSDQETKLPPGILCCGYANGTTGPLAFVWIAKPEDWDTFDTDLKEEACTVVRLDRPIEEQVNVTITQDGQKVVRKVDPGECIVNMASWVLVKRPEAVELASYSRVELTHEEEHKEEPKGVLCCNRPGWAMKFIRTTKSSEDQTGRTEDDDDKSGQCLKTRIQLNPGEPELEKAAEDGQHNVVMIQREMACIQDYLRTLMLEILVNPPIYDYAFNNDPKPLASESGEVKIGPQSANNASHNQIQEPTPPPALLCCGLFNGTTEFKGLTEFNEWRLYESDERELPCMVVRLDRQISHKPVNVTYTNEDGQKAVQAVNPQECVNFLTLRILNFRLEAIEVAAQLALGVKTQEEYNTTFIGPNGKPNALICCNRPGWFMKFTRMAKPSEWHADWAEYDQDGRTCLIVRMDLPFRGNLENISYTEDYVIVIEKLSPRSCIVDYERTVILEILNNPELYEYVFLN